MGLRVGARFYPPCSALIDFCTPHSRESSASFEDPRGLERWIPIAERYKSWASTLPFTDENFERGRGATIRAGGRQRYAAEAGRSCSMLYFCSRP
jgi:hypothetical protein